MLVGYKTNAELTDELIQDIPGLKYYPNFLTDKNHQQIIDVLDSLDYNIVNGRPTKYFGVDYTHIKKTHHKKIEEIPHFFNLLDPLGIKMDQLVIEYFRPDDGHSSIRESELFGDTIILPIGSSYKYTFSNNEKSIDFLVEPKSLLLITGQSRKWKRRIRSRIKEKFNNYIIPRNEFYVFTYRKINHSSF
jgi:hypothetical protein